MPLHPALQLLEEIVVTEGCDTGVVLLSDHGTTHKEMDTDGKVIEVYDLEYFSPLGNALIRLHKILKEELGNSNRP